MKYKVPISPPSYASTSFQAQPTDKWVLVGKGYVVDSELCFVVENPRTGEMRAGVPAHCLLETYGLDIPQEEETHGETK